MLSPRPGFPALPVILSLVRGALEFQYVYDFVAPLDCNRVRSSSSEDGLHVRVRVVPIFEVIKTFDNLLDLLSRHISGQ